MPGWGDVAGGTEKNALKGFEPISGSVSDDLNDYNPLIRARARTLFISSPMAASGINTMTTNVIGGGLMPNSRVDYEGLGISRDAAKEWQRRAEDEFWLWADDPKHCDALGKDNFWELQQIAFKAWKISGDCFGLMQGLDATAMCPYSHRLRLVEADRCATPPEVDHASYFAPGRSNGMLNNGNMCYDGVEVDLHDRIIAYHFRSTYPTINEIFPGKETKWKRVLAEDEATGLLNVLHLMTSDRPDQFRGVSMVAPVVEILLQLRRYTEAELMAAVIQSGITAFTTNASQDALDAPLNETGDVEKRAAEQRDPRTYNMGNGVIIHGVDGTGIDFPASTHPSSKYGEFVRAVAELVGAALGIPADVLLMSYGQSYSASKAANMAFEMVVLIQRAIFAARWCRPNWERIITEAVALGRLQAPGFFRNPIIRKNYLYSEWVGPSIGQLDKEKEVRAQLLKIQNCLTTRENATTELGSGDFFDNLAQLQREREALTAAGLIAEGEQNA